MKLSCTKEQINHVLSLTNRIISNRSSLPITKNVLLATDGSRLKISGTNLQVSLTTWIPSSIEEEGATTVPNRLLAELVASLPDIPINLTLLPNATQLNLSCGLAKANINTTSAEEFPPIPTLDEGISADLDSATLKAAIAQTALAAATEESRPVLTAVNLQMANDTITLTAADGFRLALHSKTLQKPFEHDINVLVPIQAVNLLNRLLPADDTTVHITTTSGQILFKWDNVELVAQLVQGTFPDVKPLIPTQHETKIVIDAAKFLKSTKTASIFAKDGSNIIRLEALTAEGEDQPHRALISAKADEVGENQDQVTLETMEGENAKIALNNKYLEDTLNALQPGMVDIFLTSPTSPAVFKEHDSEDTIHVVMPMFVQW